MNDGKTVTCVTVLVVFASLILYLRVLGSDFVGMDDPDYVLNNPLIRQLNGGMVVEAFTRSHVGWWMPLTWISLAIDYHFWALNPHGYHLTNVVLHAVNAGLVVLIADALCREHLTTRGGAGVGNIGYPFFLLFAGLFFAIHPLRVESVAWVSERKDVLNGLFALGALYCYLRYARQKIAGISRPSGQVYYLLSLGCFLLSLMAKSVSVVLPAMLLVLDWYPLGRLSRSTFWRLVREKVPFLLAALLMAVCTVLFAAQSQYLVTYEAFPLSQRLVVSGNAIGEYWRMMVLPLGLSPLYVIPDPIPAAYTIKAIVVVVALIALLLCRRPLLQATGLCFLLPLLPVLAFFQNGDQAYADRFTYLPSVMPTIAAMALFTARCNSWEWGAGRRWLAILLPSCVTGLFLVTTLQLFTVWQSTETYWTRIIAIEPLAISYKERGRYYHGVGRYADAVNDFTAALGMLTETLKPYQYNFVAMRGESLRSAGRNEEAIRDFSAAIAAFPHPVYYYHRGLARRALGQTTAAAEDFRNSGPNPGPVVWLDR